MAIELWSPFEDLTRFQREMSKMFRRPFMRWAPTVDAYSKGNDLVVKAELPGVKKEDVDVSVSDNKLIISGERQKEEKVEEKDYYMMESAYGKFQRSISLPKEVKAEDIKAAFKNGILTVNIPGAAEKARPKERKIEIEEAA
jgi:HSP20 family protein